MPSSHTLTTDNNMSEPIVDAANNGSKPTQSKSKNGSQDVVKPPKRQRQLPSLPTAISTSDMNPVNYSGLVDKTAVEWASLKNYELFSMAPDGSFPMIKISISKAVRISDRQVMPVGSGRCFRIYLSNLLTTPHHQP